MNGRLILQLALFGLAMAIATVYVVPPGVASPLWLGIVIGSAFLIARRAPGKFFLHGFLVGLANWVSVTGTHVLLFDAYVARHGQDVAAMQAMTVPAMGVLAPVVGWMRRYGVPVPGASGVLIGLLAWAGSKVLRRKTVRVSAPSRERTPDAGASAGNFPRDEA